MFLKEFKIKGKNALKTSERKRLHQDILKQYPVLSEQELRDYIPLTNTLYKIRIVTYRGIQMYLYTVGNQPTFFKVDYDDHLYPTVFTLWRWSNLLPIITTYEQVWPKLVNGADLMCPGVLTRIKSNSKENKWGKLPRGALVSVNLSSNQAIHAMGVTALSSEEMFMSGGRGKCVKIMHLYTDQLFNLYPVEIASLGPPPFLIECNANIENLKPGTEPSDEAGNNQPDVTVDSLTNAMGNLELATANVEKSENDDDSNEAERSLTSSENNLSTSSLELVMETIGDDLYRTKQKGAVAKVDEQTERLEYGLLKLIKFGVSTMQFPILASSFYRNYLLPCVPKCYKIDIKQTQYKKLSTFLISKERQGFLMTRLLKGNLNILSLNTSHPDVKAFSLKEFDTPCLNYEETEPVLKTTIIHASQPDVVEFYAVTTPVLKIFAVRNYCRGELLKVQDIRRCIAFYVRNNHLSQRDKVIPDSYLESIVGQSTPISWPELMTAVTNLMTPYHGKKEEKVEKGKLRPIHMSVQTRTGNKKVTLIDNLEMYKIDLAVFAKQCQQAVGTSASVQKIKTGQKSAQVLVQGNQINYIYKLLTEQYKIPKAAITGLENAPKQRKH